MDCIFPGSFDPITCGHLNLIRRISAIFNHVTVTLMINRNKNGCIPYDERLRLIQKACGDMDNVNVEYWQGLLSDYMRNHPGSIIVRGVRNAQDFEQEKLAAAINRELNPDIETIFFPSVSEFELVSSSTVREIASFGGDYKKYVPDSISTDLDKWLKPTGLKGGVSYGK